MHKWHNHTSKNLLLVLAFICLAYLASSHIANSDSNSKNQNNSSINTLSTETSTFTGNIPTRIKVPSINVDAPINPVGLTQKNAMESPVDPLDTAWFKLGVSPGQIGSSVIAGHRGWKTGPAVFDDLNKIKVGDKVYVEDADGNTLEFIVRETRVYNANEIAPEVWNNTDSAHLNLITCSGSWNSSTQTSDKRLVVFTELAT